MFMGALLPLTLGGCATTPEPTSNKPQFDAVVFDATTFSAGLPSKILFAQAGTPHGDTAMAKVPNVTAVPLPAGVGPIEALERVPPLFPRFQRNDGIDGRADVLLLIGTDGRVLRTLVISCTEPEFGVAASAAIMRWRFRPLTIEGKRLPVIALQTVEFSVQNL